MGWLTENLEYLGKLQKAPISPAAKKHKKEYDTKYESTPARKKYRRDLERERRKRGVDGKGGKDMSHTARGTIVPEDMHANRARHFKSKGTLKKAPQMNLSGHSAECELCGAMMNAQEASVSNQQMGVSVCTPCLMREQQRINQERDDSMMYRSEPVNKNLNRWFKEKWVDVSRTGKDGKHPPCGRSKAKKSSKGYPKCRPSVKVSSKTPKTSGSMSTGEKRAATKRKRSKKQGVGGKPTIVKAFPAKYAGNCAECGTYFRPGEYINYSNKLGGYVCNRSPGCGMVYVR
jgi:hypothetical protein|tara:strand:+ start:987 stop:1853 length:867 start_codon:yes stop_codon:yes gene_type:complete